ncbi:MAG: serine/threonine protein kinase [Xanthomonadales bacterium]|nr:serine/threonine protein kinase [Xanthomonadales bacterium]
MSAREALRIYERALDLDGPAREACLEEETRGEPALRAEVERLLGAAERAERRGFLNDPVPMRWSSEDAESADSHRPAPTPADTWPKIERYRLIEVLGEGGFGTVYRAEQLAPVQRVVALKLMRSDRCEPSFIRRFELERQTLARLSHPGIAQIYDAGTTESGDPYLAMEWVPGPSIVDYCDAHQLDLRARVAIMMRVCAAIQHAHQKGVIHRDLKPPNVLVADEDGQPAPKVIDFGIARAADLRIDGHTLETGGGVLGSPLYMSPEQVDPQSETDIDTRSDVYSLGVLLYELLCGTTPFERAKRSLLEVLQSIRELDPPRPSERAATVGAEAARARSTVVNSLPRLLAGELDCIVLRALEKRREDRYESAAALAADLDRYLADRPVEARPPGRLYRFAKLVRRNRLAAGVSLLLAISLLVGAVGSSVGFWQAQRQAERAQQTVALLQEFLASPTPGVQGKDLTVLELLENFEPRIAELDGRPETQADLLQTYAKTYLSLGMYERARAFAQRALVLDERLQGAQQASTLAAASLLGSIHLQAGDYPRAAALQERAYAGARSSLGDDDLDTIRYAVGLAEAQSKLGQNETAAALHRHALAVRRSRLGSDHPDTLHSINRLSLTLFLRGDHAEAEALSREAVARRVAAYGADHPGTLDAMSDLSFILGETGRLRESAGMDREVLERRLRVLGPLHRKTLLSMNNLAWVLDKLGEYDEAEQLNRRALEGFRAHLDDDAPEPLAVKSNLAMVLLRKGDVDAADALTREALAQRQRTLGENHPSTLVTTANLVDVLAAQQRWDEAITLARSLVERTAQSRGPRHDATLAARSQLSGLLASTGAYAEAENLARATLPDRLALSGPDRESTRELQLHLALALAGLGRNAEAVELARAVSDGRRRDLGAQHPGTRAAENVLAGIRTER